MTKISFYRSGGVFYGFEETGHTGYGDNNNDPLCAALSAMTMFIVNTIELAYSSKVEYAVDESATRITVRSKAALPEFCEDEMIRYAVSGIFMAYYYQLCDMLEEYCEYLDIEVIHRDYELE